MDDPLNAIVRTVDIAPRDSGTLDGIRVSVKDSIALEGVPMTCGSGVLTRFVPTHEASVVTALLAAGARITCVTNMDELAVSGGGDTSAYGPTKNPWDATRSAGGSSGGAAVVLTQRNVDVSIGTDQGGSSRVPAAWCGVIGFKPTFGRFPYTNIASLADPTYDHVGIMSQTVDHLAATFATIDITDGLDPRQIEIGTRRSPHPVSHLDRDGSTLEGLRLGVVRRGYDRSDSAVRGAFDRVLSKLADKGAKIGWTDLDDQPQGDAGMTNHLQCIAGSLVSDSHWLGSRAHVWQEFVAAFGQGVRERPALAGATLRALLLMAVRSVDVPGDRLVGAQLARQDLKQRFDRELEEYDSLILPTSPSMPHRLDSTVDSEESVRRGWRVLINTQPTNLTGHPAVSLPLGESEGMPVGVMLIGRRGDDEKLIEIASACETRIGWAPQPEG